MSHLRLYRAAFAPAVATLFVIAFSLAGVPEPAEPPAETVAFDADAATRTARSLLDGAPGDRANAVAERLAEVTTGGVQEQEVAAGDDEVRNVVLTLPGQSDRTILIVAAREAAAEQDPAGPAGATGMLVELATQLAAVDRDRTMVFASVGGTSASGDGTDALIDALPERLHVESALVLSQPAAETLATPHVLPVGALGSSLGLTETAGALLRERAGLEPGQPGLAGQLARLALPAQAGQEAALENAGVPAVAISSAGEVPGASLSLSSETMGRFGSAALGIMTSLDSDPAPPAEGPSSYLRFGDNLVRGWGLVLLALALLLPAAALGASILAGAGRSGEDPRRAVRWSAGWCIPGAVFVAGLYVLALAGLIPRAGTPYDPTGLGLGGVELLALVAGVAVASGVWWTLGLRRPPPATSTEARLAGSAAIGCAAVLVALLSDPYLALVLVPLCHAAALAAHRPRPVWLPVAMLCIGALPLAAVSLYVAGALDWGASLPWQLTALVAGGGIGPLDAAALTLALGALAAAAWSLTPAPSRVGRSEG